MSNQLVKKNPAEGYQNIFPKTWIDAIKDKESGVSLQEILQGFNMYFLSYNGSRALTRCKVPAILRKEGLWITYVLYDHTVVTEWYNSDQIDDNSWSMDSNWRVASNNLVGDISVSADGYWVINGEKTEARAQGEQGVTPLLRVGANSKLQASYNAGKAWKDISDYIVPRFRWNQGVGTTAGTIQISMDLGKTWTNLSNEITNNLRISRYIGINESLPTSGVAEGTIYMKGPYYDEGDTSNTNPIYRMWVYAWKGNTLAWQDNGEFTSISAGVVQERGNSTTKVMSQDAITKELTKLESEVIYDVTANNEDAKFASLSALLSSENLSTLIPIAVRYGGMSIRFVQTPDNKYVQYRLMATSFSITPSDWGLCSEDVLVESPEYINVKTDKEGKILWAIKADGRIYWGAGVPQQVIDYIDSLHIDELLSQKVDVIAGKSLINEDFANNINYENIPEFLSVLLDSSKTYIISGRKKDGTKFEAVGIDVAGTKISSLDDPENRTEILYDANGRIISYRDKNGFLHECVGASTPNIVGNKIECSEVFCDFGQELNDVESLKHSNRNKTPFVLLHFSDLHGNTENYDRIVAFNKKYAKYIDDVMLSGDMVGNDFTSSFSFYTDKNILLCIGNHETASYIGGVYNMVAHVGLDAYNRYFKDYIKYWNVVQPANAETDGKCYYYKDYSEYGIRMIVLDSMQTAKGGDGETAQRVWFENVLANVPQDYAVMCVLHYPFANYDSFDCGFDSLSPNPIVGDTPSYYSDTIESFITNGGEFICWLSGHTHIDYCGVIEGTRQVTITIDTASSNSSAVATSDTVRINRTKSQDLFNLIAVDTVEKRIKVKRIGADEDDLLRGKHSMCIQYASTENYPLTNNIPVLVSSN